MAKNNEIRRAKSKKRRGSRKSSQSRLELQYIRLFGQSSNEPPKQTPPSLRQPSLLQVVDSVTTYGAYEDPI